ncbi:hypothetical protein ACXYL9_10320 [Qipengyuania sp. CAU 1752]
MKPLEGKRPGAATPGLDAITLLAIAIATYRANQVQGKANEQLLAVPRSALEAGIEIAIDWLDLIDREGIKRAQAPENGS